MGRILGIDLGNRTVGLAVSDIMGIIANPIGTVRINDQDLDTALLEVKKVIAEREVGLIVLGFPKNMNGTVGPQGEYCLKFKEILEKETSLEVKMVDERLTTKQADAIMLEADISRKKRKQNVDKLAATIILQTYLDGKGR